MTFLAILVIVSELFTVTRLAVTRILLRLGGVSKRSDGNQ
jgi:hypothetical protein